MWECIVWDLDGTLVIGGTHDPVPGIAAVLASQHRAGAVMAVATSTPVALARAVVAELGWGRFFGHVAGSAPGLVGKDDVVAEALLGLGRPLPDGAQGTVMVGDSPGDVAAARRHGVLAVGVAWDHSPRRRETLWAAGADLVVTDPAELCARR